MLIGLNRITHTKMFHRIIIMILITIIIFTVGMVVLRYTVEGESNMPFKLTKIAVISTSEGKDKEIEGYRWGFDVYQSNDIFLYIDKNQNYKKVEAIKSINIENFTFRTNENSSVNIYKPEGEKGNQMFSNSEENKVEKLEYLGDTESNLKELKISNQGGLVVFRCSNDNIAEYKSNEEEEINHSELLKKLNIEEEQIKIEISFDLLISLENGREYKTTIYLNLPIEGVVEHGNAAKEITELDEFVFKRVKN